MKFSVCLDALYFDLNYFGASPENCLKGMKLAKAAGFDAVEFFGPKKDIASLAKLKNEVGIEISAIATTVDSWTWPPKAGAPAPPAPFITLCDPCLLTGYLETLRQRITEANQLGCKFIITHAGDEVPNAPREIQRANIVDGLKEAAKLVEAADITLVVEPINAIDHPGDFIRTSREAFDILEEVCSRNVKLLYDIYHQQVMEGNLISTITKNLSHIAYLHGASNPGRSDIRGGEINYREVLRAVARSGYEGYFGLEHAVAGDVQSGLREAVEYMREAVAI